MNIEHIAPLAKNQIQRNSQTSAASGCCGGTPTHNADACCKLDEEKKASGEEGCGCNTSTTIETKSGCCG